MPISATFQADFSSFIDAVNRADVKLADLSKGADRVEASLNKMVDQFSGRKIIQEAALMTVAIEKAGGVATLTGNELATAGAKAAEAAEKMRRLGYEVPLGIQRLADSVKQVGTEASTTTPLLGGLATQLAGMFTIGAIVAFGREVITAGDQIQKMADQTGLSTAEVQKLNYVAGQSGTSMSSLVSAVQNLQQRLGDETTGAAGAMAKLGISSEAFNKLSTYEQMTALSEAVRKIKDPTEQASVAAALFGKTWKEILPAIKAGMQEVGDQAPVMSDETVRSLDRIGDAMTRVKGQAITWGAAVVTVIEQIGYQAGQMMSMFDPSHFGISNANMLAAQLRAADEDGRRLAQGMAELHTPVLAVNDALGQLKMSTMAARDAERDLTDKAHASIAAHKQQEEATKRAAAETEKYARSLRNLTELERGYTGVLDDLGDATVDAIRYEIQHKGKVEDIARVYGVAATQVDIVATRLKEEEAAVKATTEQLKAIDKITQDLTKSLSGGLAPALRTGELGLKSLDLTAQQTANTLSSFRTSAGTQFLLGVGLIADGSDQAVQHMHDLRDSSEQSAAMLSTLADQLSRVGQAASGSFGTALAGAAGALAFLAQYQQGNLTGGQAAAGMAATGFATGSALVAQSSYGNTRAGLVAQGALTGASIGTAVYPGVGTAVGAGAGALAGWIAGMREWRKVVADTQRDFGNVHISEDLANAIGDVEDQTGLGRLQASLTQLDRIIQEAGGLRADNLAMFTSRLRDTFSMIQMGSMTTAQVTQVLDRNFAQFAAAATDSTGRLAANVRELITLNDEYGTHSQAITQYLQGQATTAAQAFNAITAGVLSNMPAFDAIRKAVVDATNSGQGLTEALNAQAAAAHAASGGLADLGIQAVASYAAAVAAGKSESEALAAIHPALQNIQHAYEDLGISTDDAALAALMFRDRVVTAAPEMVNAVGALNSEMVALDNMGLLNVDTFAAMQRTGVTMYERLLAKVTELGGTSADALGPMQAYLHNALREADLLHVPIDANTQALIDQSKDLGIWKDVGTDATDALVTGMRSLVDSVRDLVNELRGIPTRIDTTITTHRVDIYEGSRAVDDGSQTYAARGGLVTAHGVQYLGSGGRVLPFLSRGTDTVPAMLSPGEAVLNRAAVARLGTNAIGALNRGQGGDVVDFGAAMAAHTARLERAIRKQADAVALAVAAALAKQVRAR